MNTKQTNDLHQHLLDMLGAKDHQDAGRIIGELHAAKAHPSRGVVDDSAIHRALGAYTAINGLSPIEKMRAALQAAALPAAPVAMAIDPQLAAFYQVATVAELLAAQEEHIQKLQDSARRNVKPWEDTFPPTLLPKYLRDSGLTPTRNNMEQVRSEAFNLADTVIEWIESGNVQAARGAIRDSLVALAALPAVPEGESVTLTVAQIADLARFAGLTLAQPPQPTADELEAQITVCECPDTGVLLDGEDADPGLVAHYTHTAYYSEYPGEGCIGLGPELVATPKDQPAQGEG